MSNDDELPKTDEEARETLAAITAGNVDAVVVRGPEGPQVFHLEGPDEPFRTFVERMQEGALTLSGEGKILFANSYFAHLVKLDPHDAVGAPLYRFVPSRYHSTLAALIREGVTSAVKGQCQLLSDGEVIPVQLTLSPLTGGGAPACCAVVFDLREREQAEEAHAAQLAAEQSSKAKDQFLAVLSHELRSPLNTILGWAQILVADPSLSESALRAVQTIERNARTQAGLIRDLLDISRIVAGKLSLEMTHVELTELARACLQAAKPLVEQKHLTLRVELEDGVDVYGDPTRLQQILTNLLNNAVKFTEPGGWIDVRLATEDGCASLVVSDSGIGIRSEMLVRIFEIFQQGNPTQRKGGLGLGLAIAKQLTEAHGGTLTAESEGDKKGSFFTLRLPRARRSERPPGVAFEPRAQLAGVVALVVDDDEDNLDLTRYVLESAGCRVVTAASAEDALGKLEGGTYGLLVSDIGLPDQNGLELMREVRARGHSVSELPAIALTGFASTHDVRLVNAAGYQRHLAKPVDARELVRAAVELARKA